MRRPSTGKFVQPNKPGGSKFKPCQICHRLSQLKRALTATLDEPNRKRSVLTAPSGSHRLELRPRRPAAGPSEPCLPTRGTAMARPFVFVLGQDFPVQLCSGPYFGLFGVHECLWREQGASSICRRSCCRSCPTPTDASGSSPSVIAGVIRPNTLHN
ncbi:hypothetical protein FA95DRAFT_122421 [Auriscalpium vulgare]|uniref:Uncharacterized protein n=1 Tax=Auriscalpium vulgare TaxID=40419 RepID=A0ACB8RNY0_9AGAM|nr:hypothetical protein FA95DRAFT_122421 [Auriscalpium vulgare]